MSKVRTYKKASAFCNYSFHPVALIVAYNTTRETLLGIALGSAVASKAFSVESGVIKFKEEFMEKEKLFWLSSKSSGNTDLDDLKVFLQSRLSPDSVMKFSDLLDKVILTNALKSADAQTEQEKAYDALRGFLESVLDSTQMSQFEKLLNKFVSASSSTKSADGSGRFILNRDAYGMPLKKGEKPDEEMFATKSMAQVADEMWNERSKHEFAKMLERSNRTPFGVRKNA